MASVLQSFFKNFAQQLVGGRRISERLDQEIQNLTFIVHRSLEPVTCSSYDEHHLIQMSVIAGLRGS